MNDMPYRINLDLLHILSLGVLQVQLLHVKVLAVTPCAQAAMTLCATYNRIARMAAGTWRSFAAMRRMRSFGILEERPTPSRRST